MSRNDPFLLDMVARDFKDSVRDNVDTLFIDKETMSQVWPIALGDPLGEILLSSHFKPWQQLV